MLLESNVHPYTKRLLMAIPYADLNRPLDFKALEDQGENAGVDWAAPFKFDSSARLQHIEVQPGHLVLANPNADIKELRPR
jgi:peptide/nickel transport system ATP-binding protein